MSTDQKQSLDVETQREIAFLKATIEDRDKEVAGLKSNLDTEKSHVLNLEKASRLDGLEHANKLSAMKKDLDKELGEKAELEAKIEVSDDAFRKPYCTFNAF